MKRNWTSWVAGVGVVGLSCSAPELVLGDAAGGRGGVGGTGSSVAGSLSVGGSSAGGSAPTSNACETPCVLDVFNNQVTVCKLCHASKGAPNGLQSAGLDLESPNVTTRLKDIPAKHTDLSVGMTGCPSGDKLIDTAAPDASWLLRKIRGQQGTCGTMMPSAGTLTAEQRTCIETYVYCVAGRERPL